MQDESLLPIPDSMASTLLDTNTYAPGVLRRSVCTLTDVHPSSVDVPDPAPAPAPTLFQRRLAEAKADYADLLTQPLCVEPILRRARVLDPSGPRQVDIGANRNITNDKTMLRDFREIPSLGMSCADNRDAPMVCTGFGYYDLHNSEGEVLEIPFYFSEQLAETLISPDYICETSAYYTTFQTHHDTESGKGWLRFSSKSGLSTFQLDMYRANGLWFLDYVACAMEPANTMEPNTATVRALSPLASAELWHHRLGHPSMHQLERLPHCAEGVPPGLKEHAFRFCDTCHDARQSRRPRDFQPEPDPALGERFHIDFGFMRASSEDYAPTRKKPRIVSSHDGYNAYLLIVDAATRYTWCFLCTSKDPPIDILKLFLDKHGLKTGSHRSLRVDQGGELARSSLFRAAASECGYIIEPTGSDSAFQNGRVERLNRTFGVMVRSLLYSSGLSPVFWSDALIHSVYLKNRLWHSALNRTPFEGLTGRPPDLSKLRSFGSLINARVAGEHAAKLDRHTFHGVFLGYTATDSNIRYYDLNTKRIKTAFHVAFDEAHYTSPVRPPGPQFLYDLGVHELVPPEEPPSPEVPPPCPYPPIPEAKLPTILKDAQLQHLPISDFEPMPTHAAAARLEYPFDSAHPALAMSDDPLALSFIETLPTTGNDVTAGLVLEAEPETGRIVLKDCRKGTPSARIPRWRSRLRHAYLLELDGTKVNSIEDVHQAYSLARSEQRTTCSARFAFAEVRNSLSSEGVPQLYFDQLAIIQKHLTDIGATARKAAVSAKKLTRRHLKTLPDWDDWEQSEFKQLDQYWEQGMFGDPIPAPPGADIFFWVWAYSIKELDQRKKARGVCDGSSRGSVKTLDHTYAACVDQTGSRLFYSICALEDKQAFGADVGNAFAEAPGPKQTFFMKIDPVFHNWWTKHLGRPPIPPGYVLPVRRALQGHPESPRCWNKHIDGILRELGFVPTTHEPCLYRGTIDGESVLFLRQVDDFSVGTANESTYLKLCDLLDDLLTEPIKRLGLLNYFNGVDVEQTAEYIKLSSHTYIDKIIEHHDFGALHSATKPVPMNASNEHLRKLDVARGPKLETPKEHQALADRMGFSYRQAIGELIWAMITCRPDISFATVKLSQFSTFPAEIHYKAVKDVFRYLRATKDMGIYYWKTNGNPNLPRAPLPARLSTEDDPDLIHDLSRIPLRHLYGYVDSDWASDTVHRRSVSGIAFMLAGGVVTYKTRVQATVSTSSCEAEFQAASDAGKIALYVRSILDELGVPQEYATCIFEDNSATVHMANASKPTKNTRHMDIRHFALQEWVERDLVVLEAVPTALNRSDTLTKSLGKTLFYRHLDHIMGHVPPQWSIAASP